MTKEQWLNKNGYSNEGITYCILGDTYSIKDEIKSKGGKYSTLLGWHIDHKIELSDKFTFKEVHFEQLYDWSEEYEAAYQHQDINEVVAKILAPVTAKNYQYFGIVGQRNYDIPVKFLLMKTFQSQFGMTNIYTFLTINNLSKIIWFTTKDLDLKEGDEVQLTGTVKDHRIYKGENTTIMNRCIIK